MSIPTKDEIAEAGRLLVTLRNQRLGEDGLRKVGRSICRTLKEKYGEDVYRKMRLRLPLIPLDQESPTESEK